MVRREVVLGRCRKVPNHVQNFRVGRYARQEHNDCLDDAWKFVPSQILAYLVAVDSLVSFLIVAWRHFLGHLPKSLNQHLE